jgi:thiosulfate/3-mercaptopyruvate sulfurtransferase
MKKKNMNVRYKLIAIASLIVFSIVMLFIFNANIKRNVTNALFLSHNNVDGSKNTSLTSPYHLNKIINDKNIKVIAVTSDGKLSEYIPNSILININDLLVTKNGVEGLLASKGTIEEVMSKKGITNDDHLIVYDNEGGIHATRLYWTLLVYGNKNVKVLDGGLNHWRNEGYSIVKQTKDISQTTNYEAKEKNEEDSIAYLYDIVESFVDDNVVVLDVRSSEEYQKGHIPSSINIEWKKALNNDGTFKSVDELKQLYELEGITSDKEIIVHCTYGSRGSHTVFVLKELLGYENVRLYDGSWAEYSQSGLPID